MVDEKKNIKDDTELKKDQYHVSNGTLIVLILICIAILVGNGILKNHNQKMADKLIKDYPEVFDSSSDSKDILKFTSSDGIISFSYQRNWIAEETGKNPLQIALYNSNTGDACVIICLDEDLDPASRIQETADAYKRNCEDYSDVTKLTKCTIANLPAIRKDFDIVRNGIESSVSLVGINVNGKLISLSESSTSRVKLEKIYKVMESSLSINNQ